MEYLTVIFGALFLIALIFGLALIVVLTIVDTLKFIDSVARPINLGSGQITGKHFSPSYQMQYTTDSYGGGGSVNYETVPESYEIVISLLGHKRNVEVEANFYDAVEIGDPVKIEYRLGRFSRRPYIHGAPRV